MQSLQYQCDEILDDLKDSIDYNNFNDLKDIFKEYV